MNILLKCLENYYELKTIVWGKLLNGHGSFNKQVDILNGLKVVNPILLMAINQ